LFEIDDFGMSSPAGDGMVPPGEERAARLAVDNCPEYAISLTDD
jgi:ferredoxin